MVDSIPDLPHMETPEVDQQVVVIAKVGDTQAKQTMWITKKSVIWMKSLYTLYIPLLMPVFQ